MMPNDKQQNDAKQLSLVYVCFCRFRAIASSTARNCFNSSSRRVVFFELDELPAALFAADETDWLTPWPAEDEAAAAEADDPDVASLDVSEDFLLLISAECPKRYFSLNTQFWIAAKR